MPNESVNAILYCLLFSKRLDSSEVERLGRIILDEQVLGRTAEKEYAQIKTAVENDRWDTDLSWQPHGEPEIRDFLRRLLAHLDALRPWPDPPFRCLDPERWPEFRGGALLARVRLTALSQDRLQILMSTVGQGADAVRVLLLRLRSGDEVALVAPPGDDHAVLLAPRPHRAGREIVRAFVECTRYPRDHVAPVTGRGRWRGRGRDRLPDGLARLAGLPSEAGAGEPPA